MDLQGDPSQPLVVIIVDVLINPYTQQAVLYYHDGESTVRVIDLQGGSIGQMRFDKSRLSAVWRIPAWHRY